jgi:hypothetical protein
MMANGPSPGAVPELAEGSAEMASLKSLNTMLRQATELLNKAAAQIRDLDMNPKRNVRRVGEALTLVFEIQNEIYSRRPSLTPRFLKEKKPVRRSPGR